MSRFKIIECLEKLKSLNRQKQLEIIYMWIKQDHINLSEFKELIESLTHVTTIIKNDNWVDMNQ